MARNRSARVKIFFDGLMLAKLRDKSFHVELIKHHHHLPSFVIHELAAGSVKVLGRLDFSQEIEIRLERAKPNVTRYKPAGFNRKKNKGDPEDFRWVADLQSKEFHGVELSRTGYGTLPMLTVRNGQLYTASKTNRLFLRETWSGKELQEVFLGMIADAVGLDIPLHAGDNLLVLQGGKVRHRLPFNKRLKYVINVDNERKPGSRVTSRTTDPSSEGSDFRHYYLAVEDKKKKQKFDLKAPDATAGDRIDPAEPRGRYPQNCDLVLGP